MTGFVMAYNGCILFGVLGYGDAFLIYRMNMDGTNIKRR